jgi:hypothetical protein
MYCSSNLLQGTSAQLLASRVLKNLPAVGDRGLRDCRHWGIDRSGAVVSIGFRAADVRDRDGFCLEGKDKRQPFGD